jgi:hypothetical protein
LADFAGESRSSRTVDILQPAQKVMSSILARVRCQSGLGREPARRTYKMFVSAPTRARRAADLVPLRPVRCEL